VFRLADNLRGGREPESPRRLAATGGLPVARGAQRLSGCGAHSVRSLRCARAVDPRERAEAASPSRGLHRHQSSASSGWLENLRFSNASLGEPPAPFSPALPEFPRAGRTGADPERVRHEASTAAEPREVRSTAREVPAAGRGLSGSSESEQKESALERRQTRRS